jgi:hypothetical protein
MKMLKLLKWDFLNFAKKYNGLYISFAIVFVMAIIFPKQIHPYSGLVDGICAVYSMFFYGYSIFVSVAVTLNWLRSDSAQLELSLPVPPGKLLLAKLILAVVVNLSGLFLAKLLWLLIQRFGISHIVLFSDVEGFFAYLLGMTILLVIIMFSYITAKSFNFTRTKARSTTVLLALAISMAIMALALLLLGIFGICDIVTKGHGDIFLTSNLKYNGLLTICYHIGAVGVILAGFFGSSTLLEKKFER